MTKRSAVMLMLGALMMGWVAAQVACQNGTIGGGNGDGDRPPLEGLTTLVVTPPSATLTVDNSGASQTQPYVAMGRFDGKPDRDVTNEVNWKIDNTAIGGISGGGVFTTTVDGPGEETTSAGTFPK